MIRLYGQATVTTWRPMEGGGYSQGGHTEMRAAQRESEDVTVLDQMVILQHHDGFWETYPLINCSIIWKGKPTVTLLTEEDKETLLPLSGRDHTMADELMETRFGHRGKATPMGASDSAIDGAVVFAGPPPTHAFE